MNKTKIDWCDSTLNPVVGCPRACPYCYAKRMNDRYGWIEDFRKPQFFPGRLEALKGKARKSIFMNSMSDFEYWDKEDALKVALAMEENQQHNYIFLTKSNFIMNVWGGKTLGGRQYVFNGKTITRQIDIDNCDCYAFDFFSIEPILESINFTQYQGNLKQIIIGAETGNRKGKVIPKKDWVENIVTQARERNIAVFMKESLRELMGQDFIQDPLIWRIEK